MPVSEEQREESIIILTQISAAKVKDLQIVMETRNLETLSIAKTDYINNVPWNNIKKLLQLIFADSPIKLIICNWLVKYPPKNFLR